MEDRLRRLLEQIGIEIKTKKGWGNLLIGGLLWVVIESLQHRLIAAFNDWQDDHKENSMEYSKTLILWIIDHPYTWLVIVVAAILVHSYWRSGKQGSPSSQPEPKPLVTASDSSDFAPSSIDPRVIIEFLDERKDQPYKKTALMLTNAGGSEALDVQIESIQLRGQKVSFPRISGAMLAGKTERFDPKTEVDGGLSTRPCLSKSFSKNGIHIVMRK